MQILRVLTIVLATGLSGLAAQALAADAKVDPAVVDRSIAYLNGMRNLEARFVQRDQTGAQWTGKFWLSRPGRIRFEYDPPEGDVIWSGGGLVKHFDARLETVTHLPRSATPAWFLLDDKVVIDDDIEVLATVVQDGRYFVTAARKDDIIGGRITLAFQAEPERILGWAIMDDTGSVTQVELIDLIVGGAIPDDTFEYDPPIETFRR